MPDPTEIAIIGSFVIALGLFIVVALARALFFKSATPPDEALLDGYQVSSGEFAPYLFPTEPPPPPPPSLLPPKLSAGRVPVWFYRPLDLVGLGFVFVVFFGLVVPSLRLTGTSEIQLTPFSLLVSIAFQFIIAGIALAFVIGRIGPLEWLGLSWSGWRWLLLIAPGTVFGMWMVFGALQLGGYMEWMESLGVEPVQDTVRLLQNATDPRVLGLMAFAAVIAAPLCEEIVFRGYVYPAAKKFAGPWVAGICSALIFAAAHGSLAALLPLFVFGCVLAFLYEKTGSLWAPIAVHALFNGATVLVQLAARHWNYPLEASL